MRFYMAFLLTAFLALQSGTVAALSPTPPARCQWREEDFEILSKFDITDQSIGDELSFFQETIQDTLKAVAPDYDIFVIVTDCPFFGHTVRSVEHMQFPLLEWKDGAFVPVPSKNYTIYVTGFFLDRTIRDEVTEVVRREVCLIASGGARDFDRPSVIEDTAEVAACIKKAAEVHHK